MEFEEESECGEEKCTTKQYRKIKLGFWWIGEAENCELLSNKWVFCKKEDRRYKARLVRRRCEQKDSFDYEEVLIPVVWKLLEKYSIANQKNCSMAKFDVG